MTLKWRRCNIITSLQFQSDAITTSCAYWVIIKLQICSVRVAVKLGEMHWPDWTDWSDNAQFVQSFKIFTYDITCCKVLIYLFILAVSMCQLFCTHDSQCTNHAGESGYCDVHHVCHYNHACRPLACATLHHCPAGHHAHCTSSGQCTCHGH